MKTTKKIIAILLALTMALALAVTANAADIVIENPQENEVYTAYKIFSLQKSTSGSGASATTNYDYTLDSTSAAYTLLTDAIKDTTPASDRLPAGVTLEATAGRTNDGNIIYNAKVTNAAGFAKWLKDHAASLDSTKALTGALNNGVYKIDVGSDLGYYFVNTNIGAVANLTTVDDKLTINDKNEEPEIEKTVDDPSVEVGQVVTYTVTGEVPDSTGYTSYVYRVSDTMSAGLTFNADVASMKVKIGNMVVIGTAGNGETQYNGADAPTPTYANNGFTLQFDMTKFQDYVGQTITITYQAVVNDGAVAQVTTNSAVLTYSNDPADSSSTTTTPPEAVEVYSSQIVIDKYDEADATKATKLANAQFILVKKETVDVGGEPTVVESFYKYTAATATTAAKVEWVSDRADATVVTTNASGAAEFDGLEDGTYYLREIKAPAGYNLLTSDVEVVVTHTTDQTTSKSVGVSATAEVANKTGTILPSTGSIGTIGLTIFGVLIVVFGVILPKKKESK